MWKRIHQRSQDIDRRIIRDGLLLLTLLWLLTSEALAQPVATSSSDAIPEFTAVREHFETLKTGAYHAHGKLLANQGPMKLNAAPDKELGFPDPQEKLLFWKDLADTEYHFYSTFDYTNSRYRIDHTANSVYFNGLVPENHAAPGRRQSAYWVTTPDYAIRVLKLPNYDSPIAEITGPLAVDAQTSQMRAYEHFRPLLDVRSLSLLSFSEVSLLDTPISERINSLQENMTVLNRMETTDGLLQLDLIAKNKTAQKFVHTFWFDPVQGGMVVRREIRPNEPDADPIEWSRTSWQQKGEVWVPRTYQASRRRSSSLDVFRLLFRWESVNAPIDQKEFTFDALEVSDARLDKVPKFPGLYFHGPR